EGGFLEALDAEWQSLRLPREPVFVELPFRGGWALLLDYELAGQIEPTLNLPQRDDGLPSAVALRCPAAVLRERDSSRCVAVAEDDRAALLAQLQQHLQEAAMLPSLPQWQAP